MRPDNPTVGLPVVSPAHMVPVRVIRRVMRAPGVVSVFVVLPGTEQSPAPYLPGQFVTLALPTPRETLYRSYSLCGDGDVGRPWELTIKHMEMGAVSTYFFNHVVEGTLLYSSLPRGAFTLPTRMRPEMVFVFCAAGSGITPIMGMIRALAKLPAQQRPLVQLHYASRSPEDVIFGDELMRIDPHAEWLQQWHYLSSEGSRMTVDAILARAGGFASRADWYVCGPDTLKRELAGALEDEGMPEDQFHSEVFAAAPSAAYRIAESEAEAGGGSVRIAETGAELDVRSDETLLVALERHGYRPSFSCRAGACGECRLRVLEGQVSPIGDALSSADRKAGYVLSCIARPIGDVTLASGGRPPAGVARIAPVAAIPGGGSVRNPAAVAGIRFASVVSLGVLLLGSWQLTNHRPVSWDTPAPPAATVPAGTTALPSSTASTRVTSGGTPPPPRAVPTATPTKPKPTPTATCAPSKTPPC